MADTVSFQQGSFQCTLYLPMLSGLPVKNIRKLFAIMCSEPEKNVTAIEDTDAYITAAVPDYKTAWDEVKDLPTKTTSEITHARAQYNRWAKIQSIWNDTKHKML